MKRKYHVNFSKDSSLRDTFVKNSYSNCIAICLASQTIWIVIYLNRFSTGSWLIVTFLMKVFRIQCCFECFFYILQNIKSYGQHVLKSCARLENTYKSRLKFAVYFGRSEMKHLFLRWMKVNMLTAPSKVCLVEELGEHWCNLSQ